MKRILSALMTLVLILGVCASTPLTVTADAAKAGTTLATPVAKAGNTAKGIKITWNKISGAKKYVVYQRFYIASIKEWSAWQAIKTTASTSYVDTSVILGVNYRYAVRAVSGTTKGKYKSTGTIKYNVAPAVKVANTSNGVTVSWSAVANASGYTVYSSSYNEATKKWSAWKNRGTASADRTSWTDKKVKSGSAYKYTVRAVYDSFRSSYNKSGVSVRFLTQPTVKIASAGNGVKVSWTKVAGSKGYAIYRSQLSNGSWSGWKKMGTAASNKTAWVDRSAVGGASYRYTVRAVSGKHMSSFKSSSSLTYLSAPTVLLTNDPTGIRVNWTRSKGAEGYIVYRSNYNVHTGVWSGWKQITSVAGAVNTYVDSSVSGDAYYKYAVRCYKGSVKSSYISSDYIYRPADAPSAEIPDNDCTHNFTDATCTSPQTCILCGATQGEALGHTFKNGSCLICGEDCKHNFEAATCTEASKCRICGEENGEALGHSYGSNGSCTRCGEKDAIMADPFAAYQKAAQEINKNGTAGYTKKSWQTLDRFDCSGNMGSMISSLISGFMTPAEEAEEKVCGKGSDEAKQRMPLSDCSKRYVKSATAVKSGDIYTVTIVMKSQTNPSYDDNDGLARMTNDFLDIKDIEDTISNDSSISNLVKDFSGSIKYDDYTITAKMNSKGEFISIEHSGVGQVDAQLTMSLAGNMTIDAQIHFIGEYNNFNY